jgi:hypothetical protein
MIPPIQVSFSEVHSVSPGYAVCTGPLLAYLTQHPNCELDIPPSEFAKPLAIHEDDLEMCGVSVEWEGDELRLSSVSVKWLKFPDQREEDARPSTPPPFADALAGSPMQVRIILSSCLPILINPS